MLHIRNKKLWFLVVAVAVVLGFFLIYENRTPALVVTDSPPVKASPKTEEGVLKVPGGFRISVFADNLVAPRMMAFDLLGRMLVSETKEGKIVVLEDNNKDGIADRTKILLEGLRSPHGLAFYEDAKTKIQYLYVAETHQVVRYVYNTKAGKIDDKDKTSQNIANLPADGLNLTRTIAFGPNYRKTQIVRGYDGLNTLGTTKLYIGVGSSCDVCLESTWKRAAILESDPEGSFTAEFAGGLRNPAFFTFHPLTKEIWATDTGRGGLGGSLPPDEVNVVRVAESGDKIGARRYGWPFCYGDKIRDKSFNPAQTGRTDIPSDCSKTESPAIQLPAHSVPMGLVFITDRKWPSDWQNNLLMAYHGSSNQGIPTGYKIVRFKLDGDRVVSKEDFVTGWLDSGIVADQPVDLKFGPDGALYISDDIAGIIYRVMPR